MCVKQILQNKRLRYVDKISRTSAGVVLKYFPDSGLNKELEAQKQDLQVLLADGLLEGKIEADLIGIPPPTPCPTHMHPYTHTYTYHTHLQ